MSAIKNILSFTYRHSSKTTEVSANENLSRAHCKKREVVLRVMLLSPPNAMTISSITEKVMLLRNKNQMLLGLGTR